MCPLTATSHLTGNEWKFPDSSWVRGSQSHSGGVLCKVPLNLLFPHRVSASVLGAPHVTFLFCYSFVALRYVTLRWGQTGTESFIVQSSEVWGDLNTSNCPLISMMMTQFEEEGWVITIPSVFWFTGHCYWSGSDHCIHCIIIYYHRSSSSSTLD